MRIQFLLPFALLAILAAASACGRQGTPAPAGTPPDLVLITIDTFRADRVARGLTPNLDALAARGMQFTQARASAPLTLPSHVSMLTGATPPEHGVRENGIYVFGGTPRPIARRLKERSYRTAAFVGAYVLDRRFGLADGFDHYDDQIIRDPRAVHRLEAERPANEVVDRALAWLRGGLRAGLGPGSDPGRTAVGHGSDPGRTGVGTRSDPVFLWVHFYDPHAPYRPSYDAEIQFADAQAGRLLQELRTAGRDPVVIVTGDHGESLGDHGESTHGMLAYDAALRVPLILAGPEIAHARRDDAVSLTDIAPTLATLAGLSSEGLAGSARSLLDAPIPDREIYAETQYPRVAGWSPVHALVQNRWKLIVSRGAELYDLTADPGEQRNLASSRAALVSTMHARVEALRATRAQSTPRPAPADVAERLRALGYVAGSAAAVKPGEGANPADHVEAWSAFESALADLGQPQALAQLEKLATAFPDAPVFQSTYARALSERGSLQAALAIYRRAVAKWPGDAVLFHELAVAARDARRPAEALNAERAALAVEPTLPAAHNGIGLLMTDAGRHADAAAAFEAATTGDPTNAEYLVNLGNARRAAGNAHGASDAYRRASAIDPRSADAMNGLGVLLVQQQRAAEAIPLFERAIDAAPELVEARLNLGIALQESGNRDRAIAAYRDVLARAKTGSPERRAATDLLRSLGR